MDPVTLVGIVAVAVMFPAGVTLVAMGLRRQPNRMPENAESILRAVAAGELAGPTTSRSTEPARPASTSRPASTTTAKPLPELLAERAPAAPPDDLMHPPSAPPRTESTTPAVRLVPRPTPSGSTVVAERSAPAPSAAPPAPTDEPVVPRSATPAAASAVPEETEREMLAAAAPVEAPPAEPAPDNTALFVADLNRALFSDENPAESEAERSFLDAEPKLQRF